MIVGGEAGQADAGLGEHAGVVGGSDEPRGAQAERPHRTADGGGLVLGGRRGGAPRQTASRAAVTAAVINDDPRALPAHPVEGVAQCGAAGAHGAAEGVAEQAAAVQVEQGALGAARLADAHGHAHCARVVGREREHPQVAEQ